MYTIVLVYTLITGGVIEVEQDPERPNANLASVTSMADCLMLAEDQEARLQQAIDDSGHRVFKNVKAYCVKN